MKINPKNVQQVKFRQVYAYAKVLTVEKTNADYANEGFQGKKHISAFFGAATYDIHI